jgi:hypothetical protein
VRERERASERERARARAPVPASASASASASAHHARYLANLVPTAPSTEPRSRQIDGVAVRSLSGLGWLHGAPVPRPPARTHAATRCGWRVHRRWVTSVRCAFWLSFPTPHLCSCHGIWSEGRRGPGQMELRCGQGLRFNGSLCRHYSLPNSTDRTRVSIDFRAVPRSLYSTHQRGDHRQRHGNVAERAAASAPPTRGAGPAAWTWRQDRHHRRVFRMGADGVLRKGGGGHRRTAKGASS